MAVLKVQRCTWVTEPIVGWKPFHDYRIVYRALQHLRTVQTTHGPMEQIVMGGILELADPNNDVIAVVGEVRNDWSTRELHFWNDNYWVCGESGGTLWYKNHSYLLYRVNVIEPPGFLEEMAERRAALQSVPI